MFGIKINVSVTRTSKRQADLSNAEWDKSWEDLAIMVGAADWSRDPATGLRNVENPDYVALSDEDKAEVRKDQAMRYRSECRGCSLPIAVGKSWCDNCVSDWN